MYITTLNFDLIDILKLEQEFKNKSINLNTKLNGLVYDNSSRELNVLSISEFDEADIEFINEVITDYTNTEPEKDTKIVGLGLQNTKITNTEYTTIFVYDYKPHYDYTLKQFLIRAFCTNTQIDETNYNLRIVNITNNIVIGENIFTNINTNDCCLDVVNTEDSNLSTHTLEIQVKVNHSKSVLTILSASMILDIN